MLPKTLKTVLHCKKKNFLVAMPSAFERNAGTENPRPESSDGLQPHSFVLQNLEIQNECWVAKP